MGGPVETRNIVNGMNYARKPEKRAERIRSKLFDNLPENGRVEAELRMNFENEDLETEHYSGLDEVEAAYETWMAEYDFDDQVLSADLVKYEDSGEFEIRIQEVESIRGREDRGPHSRSRYHDRDNFSELAGREEVKSIKTGETVAILEGEYERAV